MNEVTITPRNNGPYMVQGPVKLVSPDGKVIEVEGDPIMLCRCGESAKKPFCDGTHRKNGFEA